MYASDFDTAAAEATVISVKTPARPSLRLPLPTQCLINRTLRRHARHTREWPTVTEGSRHWASLILHSILGMRLRQSGFWRRRSKRPRHRLDLWSCLRLVRRDVCSPREDGGRNRRGPESLRPQSQHRHNFSAARVFLEARQYSDATSLASELAKMEKIVRG